jgi:hypothetical protein
MIIPRRDVLTLSVTALASRAGFGQIRYPERPIKLMVAFSAGGVNDVVGRQWAERMRSLLGSVYVENQGGGTGTIATAEVARAPADGYTLLLGSTSTMVLNPMTMAKVPRIAAGEDARGADRLRQGQFRQALLRLRRHRYDEQSFRRAVQAAHRPQRSRRSGGYRMPAFAGMTI